MPSRPCVSVNVTTEVVNGYVSTDRDRTLYVIDSPVDGMDPNAHVMVRPVMDDGVGRTWPGTTSRPSGNVSDTITLRKATLRISSASCVTAASSSRVLSALKL